MYHSCHFLDLSPGDQQEAEAVTRLRAQPEDAEFLPVAQVTDGWCGPVLHADDRSETEWAHMEREPDPYEDRIWG